MVDTYINIPITVPSNKITYADFKERERKFTNHEIDRGNRVHVLLQRKFCRKFKKRHQIMENKFGNKIGNKLKNIDKIS